MTAGEGRRRALTRLVGKDQQLIEQATGIARGSQALAVGLEVVANVRENALCYLIGACGQIIILRTGRKMKMT